MDIRAQAAPRCVAGVGRQRRRHHRTDADLDRAGESCAAGGYGYAGQSCISVQRIVVHERVYADFLDGFVARVAKLTVGDPLDPPRGRADD